MTSSIKKTLLAFRRHLKRQGKHENTIRSYGNDLKLFLEWLDNSIGSGYELKEISTADVKDFRGYLLMRNTPPASVNRRLTALRQFFEYLKEEEGLAANPVADIPALPQTAQIPSILTRKEQLLLLRTVEKSMRPLEASILLLLLHAGLRTAEICGLTIGDLHLTPRKAKLFIRSDTGRKLRFVYLSPRSQAALHVYCKRKGISILSRLRRDEPLFVQLNGSAVTQQFIDGMVRRIGRMAGIPSVTPTVLRNTYAIQTLLNGESPDKVGRAMGISSVRSLQKVAELIRRQSEG